MSTRGAIGWHVNGHDKVTYNHFDSYPTMLGVAMLDYCATIPTEKMLEVAGRVQLLGPDAEIPSDLKWDKRWSNTPQHQQHVDLYQHLHKAQGSLYPYHMGLNYMIDSHDFLADSLFCEWAYIVNLDSQWPYLEVYKGFNQDPGAPGRYAATALDDTPTDKEDSYYGVALIETYSCASLFGKPLAYLRDIAAQTEAHYHGDQA